MPLFTVKKRCPTYARSKGGDMYFSKQKGNYGYALAVRLSSETMDRLRWRHGDRLIMDFDKDGTTGVWTLRRTGDEDGVTIVVKSRGGAGIVKASLPSEDLNRAIPNGERGYVASLDSHKGDVATFLVDYAG